MNKDNSVKEDEKSAAHLTQYDIAVYIVRLLTQKFSWMSYVKIICAIVSVMMIVLLVIKLARPELLSEVKLEVILLTLGITILLPYLSHIEALGVKVDVKEKVEELSAWAGATPYYTLASEFEEAEDDTLAEKYYQKSLDKYADFWPSLVGLGSIYQNFGDASGEPHDYTIAIDYYKRAIELDKQNLYSHNNLAAVYLDAPPPIYSPQKALEYANKALDIMPTFANSLYYKGEALLNITPPDYKEAKKALESITSPEQVKNKGHWVLYALAVANSKLGNQPPLSQELLREMYYLAKGSNDAEKLLLSLEKELDSFNVIDRKTVEQYLEGFKPDDGAK